VQLIVISHMLHQVRERLIVAYYRYKNMGNENFMEVKNLCGSTGFKMPGPGDKSREPVRLCFLLHCVPFSILRGYRLALQFRGQICNIVHRFGPKITPKATFPAYRCPRSS
jgi:hypothetical protein